MSDRGVTNPMNRARWVAWVSALAMCLLPGLLWAAGEHEVETESGFTLLMRFINFAVLAGVLFFLLRNPLGNLLHQRQQGVRESLEEAQRAREEAEARYREMESKLAQAQKEMEELKQMLIDQGRAEKEKILANAQKEADKIRVQAEISAEQELKKAQHLLRIEAVELAATMAETLLRDRIDPADQEALIQDYVETLGKSS